MQITVECHKSMSYYVTKMCDENVTLYLTNLHKDVTQNMSNVMQICENMSWNANLYITKNIRSNSKYVKKLHE